MGWKVTPNSSQYVLRVLSSCKFDRERWNATAILVGDLIFSLICTKSAKLRKTLSMEPPLFVIPYVS